VSAWTFSLDKGVNAELLVLASRVWCILEVQASQMLGNPQIDGFVHLPVYCTLPSTVRKPLQLFSRGTR
jgi:hypothetical protein